MFNPTETDLTEVVIHFATILRPDVYLELGLYKGETITQVGAFAKQTIGVDIHKPSNVFQFTFFQMSTDTFFSKVKSGEIDLPALDMVFIDADHAYEQSLVDFHNTLGYVSDHGLIFLHDTYPRDESFTNPRYCGDSYKTAWYIRKEYSDCEIVTIPCHPGLSIIRKSTSQLLWK